MKKLSEAASRALSSNHGTEHQRAMSEQFARSLLIDSYRKSYPANKSQSGVLDSMLSELLSAEPGELMSIYMRHIKTFQSLTQSPRYRAVLARALSRALVKTASFSSRGESPNQRDSRQESPDDAELDEEQSDETDETLPKLFAKRKRVLGKQRARANAEEPDAAADSDKTSRDQEHTSEL